LSAFHALLNKADRVLELDGKREKPDQAYRNVGHFVLRHSDVLLAIWDGKENEHTPGTAGMVAAALHLGLPILWVHPKTLDIQYQNPNVNQARWQQLTNAALTQLLALRLLPAVPLQKDLSGEPIKTSEFDCGQIYFSHKRPQRNLRGLAFKTLFAWFGKWKPLQMLGNDYRQDADQNQWQEVVDAAQGIAVPSATVKKHFVHADSLASFYADQYRGTFVWTFTLGATAVFLALLGAPFIWVGHFAWVQDFARVFGLCELAVIITITYLIARARKLSFHQRWVDLRLLAERLRQFAFVVPIGGLTLSSQSVVHSESDYNHVFIDWLIRTVSRAEGIPATSFNSDYRQQYQDFLKKMLASQARYHKDNSLRNQRIVHFLHDFNYVLLALIVLACIVHILVHEAPWAELATGVAAVLPAFGAAIFGVLSQGEFERIAKRSKDMEKHLTKINTDLGELADPSILELSHFAQRTIDVMSQELYDWRVIFQIKLLGHHA
jgi:hypothetical protein